MVGQSGCQLAATITTDSAGSSDPTVLGRVIRLPRIEKFALTEEKLSSNLYAGNLTGIDLQIIEKTGWDAKTGYPVQGIPTPVPGSNPQEQTLESGTAVAATFAPCADLRLAARRNRPAGLRM